VYLLTTSSTYLSRELAAELGCDGYLCNEMHVADGLFTGGVALPLCFGAGKTTRAAAPAAELGVPMADCTYYGDSYGDVPVLLAVGSPVAVNPDPRLRRFARRRAWRIVDRDRAP
jgi:phosphoserine phosphatase